MFPTKDDRDADGRLNLPAICSRQISDLESETVGLVGRLKAYVELLYHVVSDA